MTLRKLYNRWFNPYTVSDTQLVTYAYADELINQDSSWQLAKQEDSNMDAGMVWIEYRVPNET